MRVPLVAPDPGLSRAPDKAPALLTGASSASTGPDRGGPANTSIDASSSYVPGDAVDEFLDPFCRLLKPEHAAFVRRYFRRLVSSDPSADMPSELATGHLRNDLNRLLWNVNRLQEKFHSRVRMHLGGAPAAVVIAETRWAKTGKTFGPSGPEAPRPAIIHLGAIDARFEGILGSDVYFPPSSLETPQSRRSRGLASNHSYVPPWEIALGLLSSARRKGLIGRWVVLDPKYGAEIPFLAALGGWGARFIAEVPSSLPAWLARPEKVSATEPGRGQSPEPSPARPAYSLADLGRGCEWTPLHEAIPGDDGPWTQSWAAGTLLVSPAWKGRSAGLLRLVVLRNEATADCRYFMTNDSGDATLGELARIALCRQGLERGVREIAAAAGLDGLRLRHYRPLRRHMMLALMASLYRWEAGLHARPSPSYEEAPSPIPAAGARHR